MKSIYLLVILIFFSLVGNAQKQSSYWPNGNLKSVGKMKGSFRVGKWKEYYPDGQLKLKGKYSIGNTSYYDGKISGMYPNGQIRFTINYSSNTKSESATEWYINGAIKNTYSVQFNDHNRSSPLIKCTHYTVDGKMQNTLAIDLEHRSILGIYSYEQNLVNLNLKAEKYSVGNFKAIEVIKQLFFESELHSTSTLLLQLDLLCGEMNWSGQASVLDSLNRTGCDTFYFKSRSQYFINRFYLSDTLAYSSCSYDGKLYYIFSPSAMLNIFKKIPAGLNYVQQQKYTDLIFSDYYNMPDQFPDGTWLMLYPKNWLPNSELGQFGLRKINDSLIYNNCHSSFVYFQQEYVNHKANGYYREYFFMKNATEFMNASLPISLDERLPFQFNALKRDVPYQNGKRQGFLRKYLFDGKTAYYSWQFQNDLSCGQTILYEHNDSLTRIYPRIFLSSTCDSSAGLRTCSFHNQWYVPNPDKQGEKVFQNEKGTRKGDCNFGRYQLYEDSPGNEKFVYSEDSVHVARYVSSYSDSTCLHIKRFEYEFGELKRSTVVEGSVVRETYYKKGRPFKTEVYKQNPNGSMDKIN